MLSNIKKRTSLKNFVLSDLIIKFPKRAQPGHMPYLSGEFCNSEKAVQISMDTSEVIPQLDADHKEADSRMFLVLYCAKFLGYDHAVPSMVGILQSRSFM